mmetsp:Transcript_625/g.1100  ORF Transcript_625/g.1100 Transcript_625/m.1100 type:complete len:220 (-) Transcript_625:307-966(-)
MSLNSKSSMEAPNSSIVSSGSLLSNKEKFGSRNFFKASTPAAAAPFGRLRGLSTSLLVLLLFVFILEPALPPPWRAASSSSSTSSTSPTFSKDSSSCLRLRCSASSLSLRACSRAARYCTSSCPDSSTRTGLLTAAITGAFLYLPRSSAARECASEASRKSTRQRGSPPHFSSSSLERPAERDASVASTTLGPTHLRSISRRLVRKRTWGRSNGFGLPL